MRTMAKTTHAMRKTAWLILRRGIVLAADMCQSEEAIERVRISARQLTFFFAEDSL